MFPDVSLFVVVQAQGQYAVTRSAAQDGLRIGEVRKVPDIVLKRADRFVAGRVVDASGKPAAGVTVSILAWSRSLEVRTDASGKFDFEGVADTEVELLAEDAAGQVASIRAKSNTTDNVIVLHPTPLPTTSPAIKTGPPGDGPASR
jgi:hypothetical protein